MKQFDKPDINPPRETTPEEAERDKRTMGKNKAQMESMTKKDTPGTVATDTGDKPTG